MKYLGNTTLMVGATPVIITAPDKFQKYANILIDNIEGGYYNPDWHYTPAMGISGETMFGMDRKAGKDLFVSGAGKAFWDLIDQHKTQDKWKHYYMAKGESFEKTLRLLATQIMYNQFVTLSKKYLKDNTSIVTNDDCLALHFFYACWNGSGRFQKFAAAINDEIKRQGGKTDINMLRAVALNSRINSGNKLIERGGKKMQTLWKSKFGVEVSEQQIEIAKKNSKSYAWLWWTLGGLALVGGGIAFYKFNIKKK